MINKSFAQLYTFNIYNSDYLRHVKYKEKQATLKKNRTYNPYTFVFYDTNITFFFNTHIYQPKGKHLTKYFTFSDLNTSKNKHPNANIQYIQPK